MRPLLEVITGFTWVKGVSSLGKLYPRQCCTGELDFGLNLICQRWLAWTCDKINFHCVLLIILAVYNTIQLFHIPHHQLCFPKPLVTFSYLVSRAPVFCKISVRYALLSPVIAKQGRRDGFTFALGWILPSSW